ncbi:MAG TPA: tripartite tricarboxylate transporter substrate-binding protein [Reyranella sp.]
MTVAFRRRFLLSLAAAATAIPARAQTTLPNKTLRLLVGFQANGGTDIICRLIATQLERRLGRRVVVENKPGGSGGLPGQLVAASPPDGTTLAFLASTTLVAKLGPTEYPFDPQGDLTPVSLAGSWPMGLAVSPRIGVGTFAGYLAWLKSGEAERQRFGNTASDQFINAFNRMFSKELGVTMQGVTYRGIVPMVNDLADGKIPAAVSGMVSLLEHHRGRRLKLLMTTGAKRLAVANDIPTARELGFGALEVTEWFGFFASTATPPPLIEEWNRHIRAVLEDANLVGTLAEMGMEAGSSTPQEARDRLATHLKEWRARMIAVGIAPSN